MSTQLQQSPPATHVTNAHCEARIWDVPCSSTWGLTAVEYNGTDHQICFTHASLWKGANDDGHDRLAEQWGWT